MAGSLIPAEYSAVPLFDIGLLAMVRYLDIGPPVRLLQVQIRFFSRLEPWKVFVLRSLLSFSQ